MRLRRMSSAANIRDFVVVEVWFGSERLVVKGFEPARTTNHQPTTNHRTYCCPRPLPLAR